MKSSAYHFTISAMCDVSNSKPDRVSSGVAAGSAQTEATRLSMLGSARRKNPPMNMYNKNSKPISASPQS